MESNHINPYSPTTSTENQKKLLAQQSNPILGNQQGSVFSSLAGSKKFGSTASAQQIYGLSSTLSASTLQHSTLVWGFPKADRFPTLKAKYEYLNHIELPNTLNRTTTTFGFGNKINMAEINSRTTRSFPAPNHYNLKSSVEIEANKGKTFGLPFSVYSHTYQPNMKMQTPEVAHHLPGPGQYKVDEDIGSKKRKTTLKSRVKWFFEEVKPQAPPANYYTPNRELVEQARFKNITQGFGQRSNFTKTRSYAPGPGTYKLPSVFDKFDKGSKKKKKEKTHLRSKTQDQLNKNNNFEDDNIGNNNYRINIHGEMNLNDNDELNEDNNNIESKDKINANNDFNINDSESNRQQQEQ